MSMHKRNNKSSLLSGLRRPVKKVGFLLNFGIHRWRVASMLRTSSDTRRFSLTDTPGSTGCTEDSDSENQPGSSRGIHRKISGPSEEDVDKRAEIFISNFYRQLRMERQVSLELRHCRGNSFESIAFQCSEGNEGEDGIPYNNINSATLREYSQDIIYV